MGDHDQLDLFGPGPEPTKTSKARWSRPTRDLRDVERLIFAARDGTGEAFRRLTPGALRELSRLARFFVVRGNDTAGYPRHLCFTPDGAIACRACVRCGGAAFKPRPFECLDCGAWNALPRRKGTPPANPDPFPDDDIPA